MRRCGRSMNRKGRDRGTEMWLTERTRKLISETRGGVPKRAITIRREEDAGGEVK